MVLLKRTFFLTVIIAASAAFGSGCGSSEKQFKNVIIMIADGMSSGSWDAADYMETGAKGSQSYSAFPVRLGVTTYPLNTGTSPTGNPELQCGYDSHAAWSCTPAESGLPFSGYNYLCSGVTDSAAAATAMSSGIKTYNGAIGVDNCGLPVVSILRKAKDAGKSTGVVTSVPFSHATPAAFAAHELSRASYASIAHQMLSDGDIDLVMGCGHPLYDSDGVSRPAAAYTYILEEDWALLSAGTFSGRSGIWTYIESMDDFVSLATSPGKLPLAGIPRVYAALQQKRTSAVQGEDLSNPSGIRFISGVPDLKTMSLGALASLAADPDGFFLVIEGGATDFAAHAHQKGQLIEEAEDFNRAAEAVTAWVDANGGWARTLLVITSDHGNGLVLGPDAGVTAFQAVGNRGKGVMPGMSFQAAGHTNELVRLWAKGAYSAMFYRYAAGCDVEFAVHTGHNCDGAYIDNTDIFKVMRAAVEGK